MCPNTHDGVIDFAAEVNLYFKNVNIWRTGDNFGTQINKNNHFSYIDRYLGNKSFSSRGSLRHG